MAIERWSGGDVRSLQNIDMAGDVTTLDSVGIIGDMPESESYPTDLYDSFPDDVKIIKGIMFDYSEDTSESIFSGS